MGHSPVEVQILRFRRGQQIPLQVYYRSFPNVTLLTTRGANINATRSGSAHTYNSPEIRCARQCPSFGTQRV